MNATDIVLPSLRYKTEFGNYPSYNLFSTNTSLAMKSALAA